MPSSTRLSPAEPRVRHGWQDIYAAEKLCNLREAKGLSQEALANAIRQFAKDNDWYKTYGAVDAFTIRRIERDGHCPSERVRFVIATFFGTTPGKLWKPINRRPVEELVA